ncbi:MAG: HD domain-containing phosphohydrolase [Candidatus Omnitrophota bacterium]
MEDNQELKISLEKIVFALVSIVEYGDPFTAIHQSQVTRLACEMAKEINLPAEQITGLRVGGILHDIGKIRIPPEILLNLKPLNKVEMNMIQSHPQLGYDILSEVEFPWPVKQIVLQHHERMDGSGYPKGLFGEAIILETQIISVADVMEAIVSKRPYRPGLGLDKGREEISKNRGILYGPEAVDACLKLFNKKGFKFTAV